MLLYPSFQDIYIYIRAKGRKEEGERVSPGHYWAIVELMISQ